jgi:hypothetical protein
MLPKYQAHTQRFQSSFKFLLCCIVILMIMILSPSRGGDTTRGLQVAHSDNTTTYQLTAGWNLISTYLELDVASKALLRDKVAMSPDAKSEAYTVNGDLAAFQACWIFCQTEEETLTLEGTPLENFDFFASLQPGWNFAGPLTESLLSGDGIVASWIP